MSKRDFRDNFDEAVAEGFIAMSAADVGLL